jgi:dihydroxyacetone kinase-like protein
MFKLEQDIDFKCVKNLLINIAEEIMRQKDYLTTLDAACGDGDFGVGMYIGFKKAKESIEQYKGNDVGILLEQVGNAIISSVGGASGPLFGTFFIEAGNVVKGKNKINLNDIAAMFEAALQRICQIGGAKPGDKTLVDSLEPAVKELQKAVKEGSTLMDAFERAARAAKKGAEFTKDLVAKQGKARYLGQETLGHQDPGATAIYLIFNTISVAYRLCF